MSAAGRLVRFQLREGSPLAGALVRFHVLHQRARVHHAVVHGLAFRHLRRLGARERASLRLFVAKCVHLSQLPGIVAHSCAAVRRYLKLLFKNLVRKRGF